MTLTESSVGNILISSGITLLEVIIVSVLTMILMASGYIVACRLGGNSPIDESDQSDWRKWRESRTHSRKTGKANRTPEKNNAANGQAGEPVHDGLNADASIVDRSDHSESSMTDSQDVIVQPDDKPADVNDSNDPTADDKNDGTRNQDDEISSPVESRV